MYTNVVSSDVHVYKRFDLCHGWLIIFYLMKRNYVVLCIYKFFETLSKKLLCSHDMTFIINFSNFYILTTFLFLSKYATKSCLQRPNPPACMYDVSTKLSSSIILPT